MKLIHLTDTHLVPKGSNLFGRDPRVVLDAAIADINAHHADAELLVLTGDLTPWGEPEAFANLAEALAALKLLIRLLIGRLNSRTVGAMVDLSPIRLGGREDGSRAVSGVVLAC